MIRLEQKRRPLTRALRGLGMDWYGLMKQAGIEQCDTFDSACVMANQERTDAVNAIWQQYMSSPIGAPEGTTISIHVDESAAALDQYMHNQVVTSQQITVDTPSAPPVTYTDAQLYSGAVLPDAHSATNTPAIPGAPKPPAATTYTPRLAWANTSGGSTSALKSGEYWKITITGGAPNTPVYVDGGKNGVKARQATGSTDASGNFTMAGQVSDAEIGAWSEQWFVGTASAGSITFSVVAAPAPAPAPANTTPPPAGSGAALPSGSAAADLVANLTDALPAGMKDIPWYAWAGGAAAVLTIGKMLFAGGRR